MHYTVILLEPRIFRYEKINTEIRPTVRGENRANTRQPREENEFFLLYLACI